MNLPELESALRQHGIHLELTEKLMVHAPQPPPPEVLRVLESHQPALKAYLRLQKNRIGQPPLPSHLQRFLLAAANQGTGITGTAALPSGRVTDFDKYVLALATTYLAQPSAHVLQLLEDTHQAWALAQPR